MWGFPYIFFSSYWNWSTDLIFLLKFISVFFLYLQHLSVTSCFISLLKLTKKQNDTRHHSISLRTCLKRYHKHALYGRTMHACDAFLHEMQTAQSKTPMKIDFWKCPQKLGLLKMHSLCKKSMVLVSMDEYRDFRKCSCHSVCCQQQAILY